MSRTLTAADVAAADPRKLHSREGRPQPRLEAYYDPTVRAIRHPESWGQVVQKLGPPL